MIESINDDMNLKSSNDKDSTTDESLESSFTLISNTKNRQSKKCAKPNKPKKSDICYALNLFEKYGNLYIQNIDTNILFITKFKKVNFSDSKDLFEKGKKNLTNYYNKEIETVPDITFWHQRYYYYNLFDQGIKMDNESKKLNI